MVQVVDKTSVKKRITILNDKGLHTRPATEIVKCLSDFRSHVTFHYKDLSINARSLLGILMLAAAKGAQIEVEAVGEDALGCIEALSELFEKKFYMNY